MQCEIVFVVYVGCANHGWTCLDCILTGLCRSGVLRNAHLFPLRHKRTVIPSRMYNGAVGGCIDRHCAEVRRGELLCICEL